VSVIANLSALALRQVVDGVSAGGAEVLAGLVNHWFRDPSRRLHRALEKATDHSWRVLELALAGDSLWERCKGVLAGAEDRALRQQVQDFLAANPLQGIPGQEQARAQCLRELQAARKAGLLSRDRLEARELVERAAGFARYGAHSQEIVDAELRAVGQIGEDLRRHGHGLAAQLVSVRVAGGQPLLVVAARYFFRREVESDAELSRGLTFSQLEDLGHAQRAGFQGLDDALRRHAGRLDEMFADLGGLVAGTHESVRQVQAEVERQGRAAAEAHDTVKRMHATVETLVRAVQQAPSTERIPALPLPPAPAPEGAPPPPPARLSWRTARGTRTLHLLALALVEAGRQTSKPLCLRVEPVSDPTNREKTLAVSSHHLTLRYLGTAAEVVDPGSSNGTFLARRQMQAGQGYRIERGMTLSVAGVLDLEFHPVPRPDAPPDTAAVCGAAPAHAHDPTWLQANLIGADRPGWLSFLRIVRKNNLPEEEYALLFHSGTVGGGPDALVPLPGAGNLARLLVHAGQLWLERLGAEPVTVAGRPLAAGRPVPLNAACDWTAGPTGFRLEF
jgi:hypothetical protein